MPSVDQAIAAGERTNETPAQQNWAQAVSVWDLAMLILKSIGALLLLSPVIFVAILVVTAVVEGITRH